MVRILLVERMNLLRGALAAVLSADADLDVTEAAGVAEILLYAPKVEPDVVVIDLDLLTGTGGATAQEMTEALPGCAVLVLADPDSPGAVRAALDSRVRGFVSKATTPSRLVQGIKRVAAGERVIDPTLAVAVLRAPRNPLTAREREILAMIAQGLPSADIAGKLCLSRGTVANYVSTIIRKVGARNRFEAVRIADERGWLSECLPQAPTRSR